MSQFFIPIPRLETSAVHRFMGSCVKKEFLIAHRKEIVSVIRHLFYSNFCVVPNMKRACNIKEIWQTPKIAAVRFKPYKLINLINEDFTCPFARLQ